MNTTEHTCMYMCVYMYIQVLSLVGYHILLSIRVCMCVYMYIQVLLSIAPGAMQWRTHVVGALALTFQSETFGPRLLTAALLAALPLGSWARPGQQRVLVPMTAGRSGLRNPWCTGVSLPGS